MYGEGGRRERSGFSLWRDDSQRELVHFNDDGTSEVEHVGVCSKCGKAGEEHEWDCFPRVA